MKFEPVTVIVVALDPASTLLGLIDVRTGIGFGALSAEITKGMFEDVVPPSAWGF